MSTSLSPILFIDYSDFDISSIEFKVTGHRGAAAFAPENTLSSIEKALEFQIDRIEIDVQQTSDSKIILMHDLTLDRTTNGTGKIKDIKFSELHDFDAGSWYSSDFEGEKIPTLEQVLKVVNGKSELLIEIKKGNDYYPNIEQNILDIIKKYNAENWVIIHSFDTDVLVKVNKLNPNIPVHKLFFTKLSLSNIIIDNSMECFDFDMLSFIDEFSLNYNFANREIIKELKSKGKKVNVWTVNELETIKELLSIGVDGIITDNPSLIN